MVVLASTSLFPYFYSERDVISESFNSAGETLSLRGAACDVDRTVSAFLLDVQSHLSARPTFRFDLRTGHLSQLPNEACAPCHEIGATGTIYIYDAFYPVRPMNP